MFAKTRDYISKKDVKRQQRGDPTQEMHKRSPQEYKRGRPQADSQVSRRG